MIDDTFKNSINYNIMATSSPILHDRYYYRDISPRYETTQYFWSIQNISITLVALLLLLKFIKSRSGRTR